MLVSMRPQPPNHFSSSDHHRCDQEDTLSTASEMPTMVSDTGCTLNKIFAMGVPSMLLICLS